MHALAELMMCRRIERLCSDWERGERWRRNVSGSFSRVMFVRVLASCVTEVQKSVNAGHDQKVWRRVPSCSPHLQHADGMVGDILCSNAGTLYHLEVSLKFIS